ncbi:MAG: MFS transporter [Verrucomicrobiales bacterium]
MTLRTFHGGVFLLEFLNAYATAFFFNYVFFYLKTEFGFSNKQNLLYCAATGFLYMLIAWSSGKFGQRKGYLQALILGCGIMAVALGIASAPLNLYAHVSLMLLWTVGMSFTWPALEALSCDKAASASVPKMVGIYNVVWAFGNAIALFSGGAIIQSMPKTLFWIPVVIHLLQIGLAVYLKAGAKKLHAPPANAAHEPPVAKAKRHPQAALFLKMAWVANPFAYLAINSVIPLIPTLADKFDLSPKYAGFFCSVWFFARMGTFVWLAIWTKWHYRFSWLITSYLGLILSYAGMLLLDNLWAVVFVQIVLGWCLGLIYYSSLFYSLDVGEDAGNHSGIHEAAIGAGIFAGPALGALSIHYLPHVPNSSVWGVSIALVIGLAGLLHLKLKKKSA